jgi:hypothetical protein
MIQAAQVLADKAYSSKAIRAHVCRRGIRAIIPQPADQIAHRKRRGRHGGRPQASKDRLQAAQHRRALHQSAQAVARHRHPIRQDRPQLPTRPVHRSNLPLDQVIQQTALAVKARQ